MTERVERYRYWSSRDAYQALMRMARSVRRE
jgi:hypothetical protein